MEKDKLFKKILTYRDENDKAELGMIIANNIDLVSAGEAAVSVKKWGSLIEDILRWQKGKKFNNV